VTGRRFLSEGGKRGCAENKKKKSREASKAGKGVRKLILASCVITRGNCPHINHVGESKGGQDFSEHETTKRSTKSGRHKPSDIKL